MRVSLNGGFTLLELIVGIGLLGIVLTGVYKVASKSIELSENVLVRQHDNLHMHSFMGLLKRNIEDILSCNILDKKIYLGVHRM